MVGSKFISKTNGTLNIDLLNIPEKSYFRAIRGRNIVKFRLLTDSEKANIPNGSNDIMIKSAFNEKYTISRQELVSNYRYLSGKKIILAGIKSNIEYNAFVPDNTEVKYLIIPDKAVGFVRNNQVKSGMVIAYLVDESGNLSKNFGVMNINIFKKMCATPFTDKIRKNASSKNKISSLWERKQRLNNRKNNRSNRVLGSITPTISQNITETKQNNNIQRLELNNHKINANMQNNMSNRQNNVEQNSYKYMAIKRILNNKGNLIGFVLMNKSNTTRPIDLKTIAIMCSHKEIKNLTLVTKMDETTHMSKSFIRGNGIKIEELEAIVR